MNALRRLWAGRPFWITKLGQLARLVRESHARPITGTPAQPSAIADGDAAAMFLGHSSFLLQFGASGVQFGASGVQFGAAAPHPRRNLLIDPVFARRLVLLRRQRRPGVRIADLPPIDAVLLTHAHMDHLNLPSLRQVIRATRKLTGQAPIALVPRGVEDLVARLGFREVRTLEWWQSTELTGLRITLTPAKHWGARMFSDTHRLFGGYVVRDRATAAHTGHTVFHSGDTAYFPGFREIGERLGPIHLALLPIGAYFPDTYRNVHTSPEDALQAFVDLRAHTMVPMHFGTFRLGREPMDEPPVRLLMDAERRGIADRVRILTEGETLVLPAPVPLAPVQPEDVYASR